MSPCPRCGRPLTVPLDRLTMPGWWRCLHCHIDIHPEDGHVQEDPLAIFTEGWEGKIGDRRATMGWSS